MKMRIALRLNDTESKERKVGGAGKAVHSKRKGERESEREERER